MQKSSLYSIIAVLTAVTSVYLLLDAVAHTAGYFRFAYVEPSWLTAVPVTAMYAGALVTGLIAVGFHAIADSERARYARTSRAEPVTA